MTFVRSTRGKRYLRPQADYWTTDSGSDSGTNEEMNNLQQ